MWTSSPVMVPLVRTLRAGSHTSSSGTLSQILKNFLFLCGFSTLRSAGGEDIMGPVRNIEEGILISPGSRFDWS